MTRLGKEVIFGKEARERLAKGANIVANAVRGTLGPKGKAVLIKTENPTFTLDGVTVAKEIELELGTPEDAGSILIKSVAHDTNEEAGDGTTTACILTQALLNEGLKGVDMDIDPITIRKAWGYGCKLVLDKVKKDSREVKNVEDLKHIATISSRDSKIGDTIAMLYNKIGKDGVIAVEETKIVGLDHEFTEGMELDRGFIAPHFITNTERMEAIVENPLILVTSQTISMNEDVVPLLEKVANTDSKALVVICDDCKGEALATFIVNKLRGVMQTIVIKAPEYGDNKTYILEDIATLTGAKVISESTGSRVDQTEIEDLGKATRIIAKVGKTIIIGGKGKAKEIKQRVAMIKTQLNNEQNSFKKQTLRKRYARLKGGVAVIKIGSTSEAEQREIKYRIEDAVNATKSAMQEGLVIGGGLALYKASKVLDKPIDNEKDINYRYGLQVLQKALQRPAYQVLENAGHKPDVILNEVDEGFNGGFDASNGEWVGDMFVRGIIDPLKVVRVALENAISVVGLWLTNDVVISPKPKEEEND